MTTLTRKESEVMIKLFKDFSKDYNANSISKELDITPRGALKILKNLEKNGLLISKQLGKATFYKVNFEEDYAVKTIETLLIGEAREKVHRWMTEFRDIYKNTEIAILFGSVIRNSKRARDIDVVFVFDKSKYKKIRSFVDEKNKILLKPVHAVMQTSSDFETNLKTKNPVMINAIKLGFVLYGQDKIVEVVKDVTSF